LSPRSRPAVQLVNQYRPLKTVDLARPDTPGGAAVPSRYRSRLTARSLFDHFVENPANHEPDERHRAKDFENYFHRVPLAAVCMTLERHLPREFPGAAAARSAGGRANAKCAAMGRARPRSLLIW
jgi:hypothetical protein